MHTINFYNIKTKQSMSESLSGLIEESDTLEILYPCEHLCWNAKMELLGFEYAEKIDKYNEKGEEESKDYRRRQHKCMIGCAELEFDKNLNYIYYDKKVVEISFSDKIKFKDL